MKFQHVRLQQTFNKDSRDYVIEILISYHAARHQFVMRNSEKEIVKNKSYKIKDASSYRLRAHDSISKDDRMNSSEDERFLRQNLLELSVFKSFHVEIEHVLTCFR